MQHVNERGIFPAGAIRPTAQLSAPFNPITSSSAVTQCLRRRGSGEWAALGMPTHSPSLAPGCASSRAAPQLVETQAEPRAAVCLFDSPRLAAEQLKVKHSQNIEDLGAILILCE